jgi:hypothetical protein
MRFLISFSALLFLSFSAVAEVKYDRENNSVVISTAITSEADYGIITIYNEKHIELKAFGSRDDELALLCGKNTSLGAIIFLDNKMKTDVFSPDIDDVIPLHANEKHESFRNAGYVSGYVFKGDNALDLIDFLYEYRAVGLAISNGKCQGEIEAVLTINFETRGIERAMNRIK